MANPNYDVDLPDGPHNDPGPCATDQESCVEYARNVGAEDQEREWIITPFDSWERNPFYTGKPGPHPESYDFEDELYGPFQPSPISDEIPF